MGVHVVGNNSLHAMGSRQDVANELSPTISTCTLA
jgi:hypothetical protein